MFGQFGEFGSAEEINEKAAELLAAGDADAVIKLAEENGLDREDAEDYMDGAAGQLCTPLMAAFGKLLLEQKDLETGGELEAWAEYIKEMCVDEDGMAAAVRQKDKKLSECMAALVRFSFENKVQVSDKIVDITKVTHNGKEEKMRKPLYMSGMNRAKAKMVIRKYYTGR